jgi:hypothetical protein
VGGSAYEPTPWRAVQRAALGDDEADEYRVNAASMGIEAEASVQRAAVVGRLYRHYK